MTERSLNPETPRGDDGAYPLRRPTSSVPELRSAPVCGVRLLVVEDDPDQQELIVETLEEHFGGGCTDAVYTCGDALQKPLNKYDLILTDYNLPDGNGVDLLGKIKACTNAPVMLLTGENDTRTAKEAMRRGATDYVVKAGEYLLTMPLIVEKNLAAARMASERALAEQQAQQAMQ
ncbi:MAG: response regulator, partial [Planctomycetota bacterium]